MSGTAPVALSWLLGGHDRPGSVPIEAETGVPADVAQAIVEAGVRLDRHGWVPATAGNISIALDDGRIAITRSGCHKGYLAADDVMLVDADGLALTDSRPSAETLLHCQIYREQPSTGAVLHGHSIAATVLSMHLPGDIALSGYEVQKAFGGPQGHTARIDVPVFDNDQDIARLATRIAPRLREPPAAGYIIRGHGAYAWGPDMPTALVRLEALEFLLTCELERMRLR